MGFYEEFARRYLEEALKDIKRASKGYEEKDFPECVFHAQQAVEKAVKAMIEARREYVYNHGPRLASLFIRIFEDEWRPEFEEVVDILGWFTEYYTRSRYPFLLRGAIVSPSEYIGEDTAVKAMGKARRVVEIARTYLRERGVL